MAILRVVFPHTSAEGERFLAGDLREIPDEQVEFALRPDLDAGFPVMVIDETVWEPAPEPGILQGPPMPVDELVVAEEPQLAAPESSEEPMAQEEPSPDGAEKPLKRGRR